MLRVQIFEVLVQKLGLGLLAVPHVVERPTALHAKHCVVTGEMAESVVERVHEVVLVMTRVHRVMRGKSTLKLADHNVVMVLCPVIISGHEIHWRIAVVITKRLKGADRVMATRGLL
jgi:hypothetical protein